MTPKHPAARLRRALALAPLLLLAVLMPLYPEESLRAALRGTAVWWDVLFPALFPFFVVTELLLGFGIVHFLGTLFDPLMRPVFKVPGYGGFVMAMGFASGYPIGARLTAELWKQRLVNRVEGERLVAFTTSSDPVFLIGAVCVGFFHDPSLAVVLAAAHYGGSLLVGIAMRLHGKREADKPSRRVGREDGNAAFGGRGEPVLKRALRAMHDARLADDRSLGGVLKDAVKNGLKLVMMVGAMVVFLSVVLEMLESVRALSLLEGAVAGLLAFVRLPESLSAAFVNGLFEVTLGVRAAGTAGEGAALVHRAAAAAFLLSWAGLSVHAQIASLLTETGIRYRPFLRARLMHGIVSLALVYVLWTPLSGLRERVSASVPAVAAGDPMLLTGGFGASLALFAASIVILLLLRGAHLLSSAIASIMMKKEQ
jgi:sporulation integral membrane protein YlbJ